MSKRLGVKIKSKRPSQLWEMEPYGVTASADGTRPVMLFRHMGGDEVLPVQLSPIDAGIAVTQHHAMGTTASPHDLTIKVMLGLGVQLEKCIFTEVKGHHQFVELHFKGSRKLKMISARADQAISFSLQARARFFCHPEYVRESRILNEEMTVRAKDLQLNPKVGKNPHPYLN